MQKQKQKKKSVSQFTFENTGSITERDNLQIDDSFFFSYSFANLWPLLMSSSLHSHGTGAKKKKTLKKNNTVVLQLQES